MTREPNTTDDGVEAEQEDEDGAVEGMLPPLGDGSNGQSEVKRELPADLDSAGGDGVEAVVDTSVLEEGVNVDNIKTPRPVTRTIAARSLTWDDYADEVKYEILPARPDASECDRCDVECECGAEHDEDAYDWVDDDDDNDGEGDDDSEDVVVPDDYDGEGDDGHDEDGEDDGEEQECECKCECDESPGGVPYTAPRRHRATDAVERFDTPDDAPGDDDDDEDERLSLYGRAVKTWVIEGDFTNEISVRVADETGVIDVKLHPEMRPFDDYDDGDEILITDVERAGEDVDAAFEVTGDSALMHVADGTTDLSFALKEQTALVHTDDKFDTLDNKTAACNWVADVIVEEWHIETPRGTGEMYMYIDNDASERYGTFAKNGETYITEIIDQYLPRHSNNTRNINEIINRIEARTYVPEDAFQGGAPEHEARRWSVAVQNGVVDLRTGELHDFDPAWRCQDKLPIEYDPTVNELGEEWDWFLSEITRGEPDRETLMYIVGHALARCYPADAIFSLIGPGENGKTVWHDCVRRIFEPVADSFSFEMITDADSPFGTKPLVGNHLIIDDDATDVKAQNLGVAKKHSGGAEGQINIKDVQVSGYRNYASMVMLTNNPPVFGDLSDGAKRRMHPVIMPHRFTSDPTDDNKDSIPEDELKSRLTSEEELEALLAVGVQYSQALYRDSEIEAGRTEDERWELYESYSDSILRFWEECMVEESGARVPRSVIYEIYVQWAQREGVDPLSPGGGTGFWPLSDQCHAVSYKRGVYTNGERAVEHVMLGEKALDYAPQWVADEWSDDVVEDESTLANRLDRVTPITDLNKGYCTTEGRVIGREVIDSGNGQAVKLTIEDGTHAIDVYDWLDDAGDAAVDGIDAGDKVRFKRAQLTAHRGVPQLKINHVTEIDVIESPLAESDTRHVEGDEDEPVEDVNAKETPDETVEEVGDVDQESRVKSVKDAIVELADEDDAADIDAVIDLVESDAGIDAPKTRHELDKLRRKGDAYKPQEGRVRLTGGD